jgi:Zn-dependent protease with chaperone function
MQLFPILVVAVILLADGGLSFPSGRPPLGNLGGTLLAIGPVVVVVLLAAAGIHLCRRRMIKGRSARAVVAADRLLQGARLVILAGYAIAVLYAGWLDVVRSWIGDLVLLDELIAMLPPLLGISALWWVHYPIERHMREALLIRRLDLGRAIYQIPTRWRYVLQQLRSHLLLLLVPIVIILALAEAIHVLFHRLDPPPPFWTRDAATFVVGIGVFICAPLIARVVLNVTTLRDGPAYDDLADVCVAHRVRMRGFLLWNTDGAMLNAAVMGLFGPLRYVLVTDALLEMMTRRQVQAVIAHEVGHVRRHHMPWMVISLLAVLLGVSFVVSLPFVALELGGIELHGTALTIADGAGIVGAGAIALILFGWMSRRYERQADTFAVQHLSRSAPPKSDEERPSNEVRSDIVTPEAVYTMHSALESIARLNSVDPQRRSWRHGSIAWRQSYLASIIGQPLDRLPIDRVVRRMKLVALMVLVASVAATIAIELSIDRNSSPAGPPPAAPWESLEVASHSGTQPSGLSP